MKLVFIYGPPGVGKLTVAKELSNLTGFKLFHNHVSIDFASSVFDFGTAAFWHVVRQARHEVLSKAAQEAISLIFTYVYEHPNDLSQVRNIVESVEKHGGSFCPVQLVCSRNELELRAQSQERIALGKLSAPNRVGEYLNTHDLLTPIPNYNSLCVDNTHRTPRLVAQRIVNHYEL